ncbi:MAG: 50S ribosomal protein L19 [Spirochaetales bacterium]|nr:50S ribosomal protein L19 [Spirochaetales bacterium]
MDITRAIENEQIKENMLNFNIGDTIKVHYKIIEGKNERIQVFEGVCIAIKGSGISKTFTVRKISYGVGVERVFPINSPKIEAIDMIRRGRIRRAKLYYLRDRMGKAAKIRELIIKKGMKRKKSADGNEFIPDDTPQETEDQ